MKQQLTKAINGKMYSFNSRLGTKDSAREKAKSLNGEKHAYYTKVIEKGTTYFDVRLEN